MINAVAGPRCLEKHGLCPAIAVSHDLVVRLVTGEMWVLRTAKWRITARKKVDAPRAFGDDEVSANEAGSPEGVKLIRRVG